MSYDYNTYVKDVKAESWFESCRRGTISSMKELDPSLYIGTLDLRITHCRHNVF